MKILGIKKMEHTVWNILDITCIKCTMILKKDIIISTDMDSIDSLI